MIKQANQTEITETETFLVHGIVTEVEFSAETPDNFLDYKSEVIIKSVKVSNPDAFKNGIDFLNAVEEAVRFHKLKASFFQGKNQESAINTSAHDPSFCIQCGGIAKPAFKGFCSTACQLEHWAE